jgi:hypothetical protein
MSTRLQDELKGVLKGLIASGHYFPVLLIVRRLPGQCPSPIPAAVSKDLSFRLTNGRPEAGNGTVCKEFARDGQINRLLKNSFAIDPAYKPL